MIDILSSSRGKISDYNGKEIMKLVGNYGITRTFSVYTMVYKKYWFKVITSHKVVGSAKSWTIILMIWSAYVSTNVLHYKKNTFESLLLWTMVWKYIILKKIFMIQLTSPLIEDGNFAHKDSRACFTSSSVEFWTSMLSR